MGGQVDQVGLDNQRQEGLEETSVQIPGPNSKSPSWIAAWVCGARRQRPANEKTTTRKISKTFPMRFHSYLLLFFELLVLEKTFIWDELNCMTDHATVEIYRKLHPELNRGNPVFQLNIYPIFDHEINFKPKKQQGRYPRARKEIENGQIQFSKFVLSPHSPGRGPRSMRIMISKGKVVIPDERSEYPLIEGRLSFKCSGSRIESGMTAKNKCPKAVFRIYFHI